MFPIPATIRLVEECLARGSAARRSRRSRLSIASRSGGAPRMSGPSRARARACAARAPGRRRGRLRARHRAGRARAGPARACRGDAPVQRPLIRRCERRTTPPSNRRTRFFPTASTASSRRPSSRSAIGRALARGCGVLHREPLTDEGLQPDRPPGGACRPQARFKAGGRRAAARPGTRPRRATAVTSLSVTGSPSKRSTASRLRRAPWTWATSAASAGRSHTSSGSRSGTSERPPRSTKSTASPPRSDDRARRRRAPPAPPPVSATAAPRRRAAPGRRQRARLRSGSSPASRSSRSRSTAPPSANWAPPSPSTK